MHGLGNDFVVLEGPVTVAPDDVARWSDRRRGIGADGVLVVTPVDAGRVRMEYWNADGSAAEMCGNGLRCVARYAVDRGWVPADGFVVETTVGPLEARLDGENIATVEVGYASVGDTVSEAGMTFTKASVGNPHAVTFVEALAEAPVTTVGRDLEAATPGGVNVEFAEPVGDVLAVRTWERGCGETHACGTGAVAVAAVARATGRSGDEVTIRLVGGDLRVRLDGDRAWITGLAEYAYRGVV